MRLPLLNVKVSVGLLVRLVLPLVFNATADTGELTACFLLLGS
jgi:hypothetical protein